MKRILLAGLILMGCAFAGAHAVTAGPKGKRPAYYTALPLRGEEFDRFVVGVDTALRAADWVMVFEGVPRHTETEVDGREHLGSRIIRLKDAEFHAGPQRPDTIQVARLPDLLTGSLAVFRGVKLCGGFHADYAVVWGAEGRRWVALFCLSCGEAAVFSPGGSLLADLDGAEGRALRAWLSDFRRQRPAEVRADAE